MKIRRRSQARLSSTAGRLVDAALDRALLAKPLAHDFAIGPAVRRTARHVAT
jgi:hypothetical protein